jgi:two-component system, sensor histidine kinase and response regulator
MSAPPTVLVVDDEPTNVAILEETREEEYSVVTASRGDEALRQAEAHHPDIVLLDIMMPGMDGLEVCRRLREDRGLPWTKILLVSACAMLNERLDGYAAGADDYITKPFESDEILAKVRVFFRLKRMEEDLHAMKESLAEQVAIRSRQLGEAQRLATIGRMAAGIVHNLNNPLASVMGYADMLAEQYPDQKRVRLLQDAANNMRAIVGSILAGARGGAGSTGPVDLNAMLRESLGMLETDLFYKHSVEKEILLEPLPPMEGRECDFRQIADNLLRNALDAMVDGDAPRLQVRSTCAAGRIRIDIVDNGDGIPPEARDKVFDPFFTTKPFRSDEGRPTGNGLGLASCREMAAAYGGELTFRCPETGGTVFTLRFPVAPGAAPSDGE